jgi:hypothetical protein
MRQLALKALPQAVLPLSVLSKEQMRSVNEGLIQRILSKLKCLLVDPQG